MKKGRLFWPLAAIVVIADFITKRMVLGSFQEGESRQVMGEFLRFTLGFNNGIAFGLSQYDSARPALILFTVIAVAGIVWIYRTTDASQKLQIVALGLILGGAIGNMLDRLQRVKGVVDFIDVGIGDARFWTFNIADSAITVGAVLLILSSMFSPKDHTNQHGTQADNSA
jgi:signal peptidase II